MINKERLMDTFLTYVKIDSETKNERAISQRIAEDMRSYGFEVYVDDAGTMCGSNGGNVYCRLQGSTDSEPIMFSAHMDTVTPGNGIEPYIEDGFVKSRGKTILAGDDKSGVAAIIEAMRTVKESNIPHRTVEAVFSIFEEGGLFGAKNVDLSKVESKIAVVLDTGGGPGSITIQAPGHNKIHAVIHGTASHAGGSPEKGVSAIMVAAEAVTKMKLLRIDEETTANIGTLSAIGATNIVSPLAELEGEARSRCNEKLTDQTDHMVSCIYEACFKYGAYADVNVEKMYQSYSLDPDDELICLIADTCTELGLPVEKVPGGGGSDANIYNKRGIKSVVIGCGMIGAHTTDEKLCIEEFEAAAEVLVRLMTK